MTCHGANKNLFFVVLWSQNKTITAIVCYLNFWQYNSNFLELAFPPNLDSVGRNNVAVILLFSFFIINIFLANALLPTL